jgi:hypothetical protein
MDRTVPPAVPCHPRPLHSPFICSLSVDSIATSQYDWPQFVYRRPRILVAMVTVCREACHGRQSNRNTHSCVSSLGARLASRVRQDSLLIMLILNSSQTVILNLLHLVSKLSIRPKKKKSPTIVKSKLISPPKEYIFTAMHILMLH